MSIKLSNLTKIYGTQKAVDNISFEIPTGQIVGFLGPNGAGKSTTMKMLTGFISATSGTATINGLDIEKDALEVRKLIGYLPENNPQYTDMYVAEYLQFVASVYKLGTNANKKVEEMIALTGLTPERKKKIGQLSKGYRQRVGIAQAMIHDPKVLILDEPTSGLDPNQLVDIRNLIIQLGKQKTVILSTHIMQEVQAMCDRAIIINKGVIVADNSIDALTSSDRKRQELEVEFVERVSKNELMSIDGVIEAHEQKGNAWRLVTDKKGDMRVTLFEFAKNKNYTLIKIQVQEQNMEDVFKELTQKK
jgi:ABC-2 type transport system ATP-binding protein